MSKEGDNFVFVGGCPRSGTSLLQKMLDLHSEIYAGPEFDHMPKIGKLFRAMMDGIHNERQAGYYDEYTLRNGIRHLVNEVLGEARAKHGVSLLSEKTPGNVLVFEELYELFPKAKFIFVVRDPRGIYNSFKMVGKRAKAQKIGKLNYGVNLKADLNRISQHIKAGTKFVEKYPQQSIVVEYEELVSRPVQVIEEVCEFLGVSYEPTMLNTQQQNESSRLIRSGGKHVSAFYNKDIYDRKVDANSSVKWKTQLNWMEKNAVAYYFQSKNIEHFKQYDLKNNGLLAKMYLLVSRGVSLIRYVFSK